MRGRGSAQRGGMAPSLSFSRRRSWFGAQPNHAQMRGTPHRNSTSIFISSFSLFYLSSFFSSSSLSTFLLSFFLSTFLSMISSLCTFPLHSFLSLLFFLSFFTLYFTLNVFFPSHPGISNNTIILFSHFLSFTFSFFSQNRNIPLVLDGDALWLVSQKPSILQGKQFKESKERRKKKSKLNPMLIIFLKFIADLKMSCCLSLSIVYMCELS